jgi:hypothetical protein
MPWSFAGSWRNAGLDRFVGWSWAPPRPAAPPKTSDVPRSPRKGTLSACAHCHACTGRQMLEPSRAPADDTSFARSSDPCRSIATSELLRGNPSEVARSSRYRVRENLAQVGMNRTRGLREWILCGSPRLTAPAREPRVRRQKRKGVTALVPARNLRELEVRARTSYAVAEVDRRRLVSKKLVKRAPKRAAGASERGPRSPRPTSVTRRWCAEDRNDESPTRIASDITERDREKAQGDVRASSNGLRARREAGAEVAGPGL